MAMAGARPREPPPGPAELPAYDRLPDGPAFLIIKATGIKTFKGVSPFKLKRELDDKVGPLHTAKVLRPGAILVKVTHKNQGEKVLQLETFLGLSVQGAPRTDLITLTPDATPHL